MADTSLRLAVALGVLGAGIAVIGALLASLARRVQVIELRAGDAWRETLLVQVAISFAIISMVVTIIAANARRCDLLDDYTAILPGEINMGGPALRRHLDAIMLTQHNQPFCNPEAPRPTTG